MRAVDKAYQAVRQGIIAGRFAAGTRITEHEVAVAAGVSRTPAREALRRLHSEGLVEFTPNQGAIVTTWSVEDADEIFDLRALLEAALVMRTFRNYTPEDLERSATHHLELVLALEGRDADWAASVMRAHIHSARRTLRRERDPAAH